MDHDMRRIVEWLDGSDWSDHMYDYCDYLRDVFGQGIVYKYWNYDTIVHVMREPGVDGRREILMMLKYMVNSEWDMELCDYTEDIADSWGRVAARKFRVNAIVDYIEAMDS